MAATAKNLRSDPRTWIWAALTLQLFGLAFDAVWHGLLKPDFEAVTVDQMVTHLTTVHLPIYIGVLSVFVSTAWAVVDQTRRSKINRAMLVALAGALLSTVGEIWHAYTHLQMSTHGGAMAGSMSSLGFIVVIIALWLAGRSGRQHAPENLYEDAAHNS